MRNFKPVSLPQSFPKKSQFQSLRLRDITNKKRHLRPGNKHLRNLALIQNKVCRALSFRGGFRFVDPILCCCHMLGAWDSSGHSMREETRFGIWCKERVDMHERNSEVGWNFFYNVLKIRKIVGWKLQLSVQFSDEFLFLTSLVFTEI